jgi:choline dehydrogenase-like flavoprotein
MPLKTPRFTIIDLQLRVRPIASLRVADASIIPAALNACTHAPTVVMIGERAAAMMFQDVA